MRAFFGRLKNKLDYKKIGLIAVAVIMFLLVMDLNSRLNDRFQPSATRRQQWWRTWNAL